MLHTEFSLKERDRKRLIKDRFMRYVVKAGGISVLVALLLIFFYLLLMVLPVFSSAKIEQISSVPFDAPSQTFASGVDDYGQLGYVLSESGTLTYVDLKSGITEQSRSIQISPLAHARMPASSGWFAFLNSDGEIQSVKPNFAVQFNGQGRSISPRVESREYRMPENLAAAPLSVQQFAFAINNESATFAFVNEQNQLVTWQEFDGLYTSKVIQGPFENLIGMNMTPDGRQLFLLSENDLAVMVWKHNQGFVVREVVDITQGDESALAKSMTLLAGAQSLLVHHQNNTVSQWFDVLKERQRTLSYIREFSLPDATSLIVPEYYRKGFYVFSDRGQVDSFYTTSEERTLTQLLLKQAPVIAAVSSNEDRLLTVGEHSLQVFTVDNEYPEISLSALWQSVWYEGYPEPQYVWQSTSGSDDFEAKFSLVPIAFGTLKAAFFAMLFAVPIAVLGAIYTAYFMSAPMRKVVKPAIEIMEALPTVIIGFLAGLWLAPVIETHLPSTIALIVLLPASTILIGWIWHNLPAKWLDRVPSGWHGLILIPALLALSLVIISFSHDLERALFGGDVRVYLANIGIDYDQRNALVVGLAMGFAVIPTIFTIAEDAIFSVPKHLSDGSLALGATKWQTLIYVVLLTASPGIFSAVMMGLGRAVGETMIVLMATGNTPVMDWNIFEGLRSLSATIAIEMPESDVGSSHYRLLFLAALILFMFTFFVNSLAEWVRQRLRDKYSAL
ncbi:ABC transporter permease subunit [Vibrio nigripulchritudo]|uniref:ABC transporter permease subunit n=1 Tax=Vibrio nigripulchritudo TaxID=28173 RepID=UPI002490706D|nr:ABC transporter permease subunit [Vibrio nigripulchritudo]BDU38379.1 phosphate ABC transporter permease [Vibrio nigripulchritudo]BDU44101.1 phosphate ABC transporter permease [Vibrio nigripulchritudo]